MSVVNVPGRKERKSEMTGIEKGGPKDWPTQPNSRRPHPVSMSRDSVGTMKGRHGDTFDGPKKTLYPDPVSLFPEAGAMPPVPQPLIRPEMAEPIAAPEMSAVGVILPLGAPVEALLMSANFGASTGDMSADARVQVAANIVASLHGPQYPGYPLSGVLGLGGQDAASCAALLHRPPLAPYAYLPRNLVTNEDIKRDVPIITRRLHVKSKEDAETKENPNQ